MRLKGKRALVTGGAAGIGHAIVERFLDEGAAVVFCDINECACRTAEAQFSKDNNKVHGIVGDVSKSASVQHVVKEAVAFLGGLDILVNNAGVFVANSFLDCTDDEWEHELGVNVGGVFRMSKHSAPWLIQAGGGSIVNIGSISAFLGFKGGFAYGTSKGAVVQMTRNMAAELAPHNVRVNSVNPGVVDTRIIEHARDAGHGPGDDWEAARQSYIRRQLLERPATPAEVASAVLFLASDEASFITGTALMVDGGCAVKATL